MALSFKEIKRLGRRYESYFSGMVARDLCVRKKGRMMPRVEIRGDGEAWTGDVGGRQIVHIGLQILDKYPDGTPVCKNESDFLLGMRFLTGHEAGHQKYTTERGFQGAINGGYHGFVEYCYKTMTGKVPRLVKESDYDRAVAELSNKYGIAISDHSIKQIVHFIANSIEDGRMERLCGLEKPGFKNDIIVWRSRYWMHSPITDDFDISKPDGYLLQILNQVLSLATSGVWQKGFTAKLAGTKVENKVISLYPYIKDGATSRSCAKGMKNAQTIMEMLYPEILDSFKNGNMEQMLGSFMSSVVVVVPDTSNIGKGMGAAGASEKEDAENANGASGGTAFKIYSHNETDSNENGQADGAENESDSGNETDNDNSENKNGKNGKTNKIPKHGGGRSGSKGQDIRANDTDAQEIIDAMKEAAAEIDEKAEAAEETVREIENSSWVEETEDTSNVFDSVSSDVFRDLVGEYHEFTREYEVTDDLPYDIQQECAVVRRQYEKYFKSRRTPERRNQKSGRLDSHQLHRLVRGDLDVYKKPEEDNSFSGCIEILLDNSGSMSGFKKNMACETLTRVEEYLKGFVPIKIIAFDYSGDINVEIIKNWKEVYKKNCSWNYKNKSRAGGGTPTPDVLKISYEEIKKRTEDNKMIILLTDETADCSDNNLSKLIREIRKNNIQLCGIYFESMISDSAKASFYNLFENKDAIVCKPQEISSNLLPVIRDFTRK